MSVNLHKIFSQIRKYLDYQNSSNGFQFQLGQNCEGGIAQIKSNRHKKVERMVFLMIFAYNMSWTPYALVCFLRLVNLNFLSPAWTVPGFIFTKWWVIENHLESNPYINLATIKYCFIVHKYVIVWTSYNSNI